MFTGIVEATASILVKTDSGLTIERPEIFDDIKIGSSICVSGVCLSITAFDEKSMEFDVVEETYKKSKLGSLKEGDIVNLERSMRADGRFEGHVVQGHAEAYGQIENGKWKMENECILSVTLPKSLLRYVLLKGSITLDGVSLTVANIEQNICSVALIPHTLENTTLGTLKEGDLVNIETDILVRCIQNSLHPTQALK